MYFNEDGDITNELSIPIEEWFSSKVYLNSAFMVTNPEPYPFKVDDMVDAVIYVKEFIDDDKDRFNVVEKEYTGRISSIKMTKREYTIIDEMNVTHNNLIYYYLVTIDMSKLYEFDQIVVASTVIKSMVLHEMPPEEP